MTRSWWWPRKEPARRRTSCLLCHLLYAFVARICKGLCHRLHLQSPVYPLWQTRSSSPSSQASVRASWPWFENTSDQCDWPFEASKFFENYVVLVNQTCHVKPFVCFLKDRLCYWWFVSHHWAFSSGFSQLSILLYVSETFESSWDVKFRRSKNTLKNKINSVQYRYTLFTLLLWRLKKIWSIFLIRKYILLLRACLEVLAGSTAACTPWPRKCSSSFGVVVILFDQVHGFGREEGDTTQPARSAQSTLVIDGVTDVAARLSSHPHFAFENLALWFCSWTIGIVFILLDDSL